MEKQMPTSYARIAKQVEAMRRLYSRIGEPLPVDIIIDLYQHLGPALNSAEPARSGRGQKRRPRA